MISAADQDHPSLLGLLLIAVSGIAAFSLCGTLYHQQAQALGIPTDQFLRQIIHTDSMLHFLACAALPFLFALIYSRVRLSRKAVVTGITLLTLMTILGLGQWGSRVRDVALCMLTLIAATGWGSQLLSLCQGMRRNEFEPRTALRISERICLTISLGLAMVSFLTAIVGMIGVGSINAKLASCIVILPGIFLAIPSLRSILQFLTPPKPSSKKKQTLGKHPGRFAPALIFSFILVGTLLLLLNTRFPEMDYDVLEYHAQLPREYMDLGRIAFLPHNAFCGFPQAMEILTLLCGWLDGNIESGLGAAKLLHFSFLPILLCGLYSLARRLGANQTCALLTGLPVLLLPMSSYLSTKLYVEFGLGAFMICTLLALRLHSVPLFRRAIIAGLLAGGAAACKYPGVLLAMIPASAVLFYDGTRAAFCGQHTHNSVPKKTAGIVAALLCLVAAVAVLSPWLLKNAIATGNPVYPLLANHIPTRDWTPLQQERFTRAHRAPSDTLKDATDAADRIFHSGRDLGISCVLFSTFALSCLLFTQSENQQKRLRQIGWLILLIGYATLVWFYLTHRIDRFYWPLMLLLAGCSGLFLTRAQILIRAGKLTHARIAPFCFWLPILGCWGIFMMFQSSWAFSYASKSASILDIQTGRGTADSMFREDNPLCNLRLTMEKLPAKSKLMLVGEAQPFWLPKPVDYAVVFSQHPLWTILKTAKTPEDIRSALHERGITHLYINWVELARLHATYYQAYELTSEQQLLLKSFLLQCCTPASIIMTSRWDMQYAVQKSPYIAKLAGDYNVLFSRTGWSPIAQAPYELFSIQ